MNALKEAQGLTLPERNKVLVRDYSVQNFWDQNGDLLVEAWKEWDADNNKLPEPGSLIDTTLREKVDRAWQNPETEQQLNELIHEVSPGVYEFQLFAPEKIEVLRKFPDRVGQSQIPVRPPYGIVLNRKGAMLDKRSVGYLAAPSFQALYQQILDHYMRPIARMLFPEITGFDG